MIPVMWLSAKHTNNPIPQIAYGSALLKLSEREKILATNQQEQEVRTLFKQPANEFDIKLQNLPKSWEDGRIEALHHVEELKTGNASLIETKAASRALTSFPKNIDEAKQKWAEARAYNVARAEPVNAHIAPFSGKDKETSDAKRNNFLALVFCLMMGTAALPHVLVRYYTTSSVQETRLSVFWTLFFIMLL